jgi:DNA repair protein RadD
MKALRPYQRAACDAFYDHIHEGGKASLIELATGLGKSYCIATICRELIADYPKTRILSVVHTRELVRQNAQELFELWPQAPFGINSAGLGQRDWHKQIIFASIQSIHKYPDILGKFDLVIIDECHLLPKSSTGMYQRLLADLRDGKPRMRTLGLTATPFRLDSGWLDRGASAIFEKTVYKYGIAEGIRDGYLAKLSTKSTGNTDAEVNTRNVSIRAGEFVTSELEDEAMKTVRSAIEETIAYGRDRCGWLLFAVGVRHAKAVNDELVRCGVKSALVTGKTPKAERDEIIGGFARGQLRALVNVGVLTTGFNVPHVDLIALLRPTQSPGLAIQMIGRGTRLAPGKENCLVLDFGRILKTHGPVDQMAPPEIERGKGRKRADEERVKICPFCNAANQVTASHCAECDQEFPKEMRVANHEAHADAESSILSNEIVKEEAVDPWFGAISNAIPTLESDGFIDGADIYRSLPGDRGTAAVAGRRIAKIMRALGYTNASKYLGHYRTVYGYERSADIKPEPINSPASELKKKDVEPKWLPVTAWRMIVAQKSEEARPYFLITYLCGLSAKVNEFLFFDATGVQAQLAARRWIELTGNFKDGFKFTPQSVKEAFERRAELKMPARIQIRKEGKYFKVLRSDAGGSLDDLMNVLAVSAA